jgi:hypothetical protein
MAVTFNPKHTYVLWPDFSGTGGRLVYADSFEVTQGAALIFSSRGDDGSMYVTRVVSPHSYAHMMQADNAGPDATTVTPLI